MSKEVLVEFSLGKGCLMRLVTDEEAPADSIDRYYSEVIHNGNPGSDPFYVPPHWHKKHDEVLIVTESRLIVTVEGRDIVMTVGDEPVIVPRLMVHSMRSLPCEPFILKERTIPTGSFKLQFFNDLFAHGMPPSFLHAMRTHWDSDAYVHLPFNSKLIDQLFVFIVGGIAKLLLLPWQKSKRVVKL